MILKRNGHKCWIVIWVDDILYCSTDKNFRAWFKGMMQKRFTIGDDSPLIWFLGTAFKVDERSVTLNHSVYVSNLLQKHSVENCKPQAASTPLAEMVELSREQMPEDGSLEQKEMKDMDYRRIVGSISYLALSTRPYLCFTDNQLAKFLFNPGKLASG